MRADHGLALTIYTGSVDGDDGDDDTGVGIINLRVGIHGWLVSLRVGING